MSTNPTPGARVRITIEGTVATAEDGGITLTNRIAVEWTGNTAPSIEVLEPGFRLGDVVRESSAHLGDRHLMRVRVEGVECWMAPDGYRVHDDELDVTQLAVVVRAEGEQR